MPWSIRLFTIRSIPVRLHATFFLIIAWALYVGVRAAATPAELPGRIAFMVAFVLLLFLCILLHEFGHAFVAQLFGMRVQDITLWPLGGLARMPDLPHMRPLQEFLVTAAGPSTSILLTLLLILFAVAFVGPENLMALLVNPALVPALLARSDTTALLLLLLLNNAVLALFNLLPAFPMDGGRLLRAVLAGVLPFERATRVATWVSQGIAVLLLVAALLINDLTLTLGAAFVLLAAWSERQQSETRADFHGIKVSQAMQPPGVLLHPLETLAHAAATAAASDQPLFLVMDGGRLAGLVAREQLLVALKRRGPYARVESELDRPLLHVAADDDLVDAQARLASASAHGAVVITDGQVAGILSKRHLRQLAELIDAYPDLFAAADKVREPPA